MRRRLLVVQSLSCLAALGACDFTTEPQLPTGAVSFSPPAIYREW